MREIPEIQGCQAHQGVSLGLARICLGIERDVRISGIQRVVAYLTFPVKGEPSAVNDSCLRVPRDAEMRKHLLDIGDFTRLPGAICLRVTIGKIAYDEQVRVQG